MKLTVKLSDEIGPIHFIGIGGIGMSGIADVLRSLGYQVQGSDLADNYNVARLRQAGVTVHIGHRAENVGNASIVVTSSAVPKDNPEVIEARARFIPVVRRAEMLAELMRFKSAIAVGGTHGKTTTTSMVATLLEAAGFDPTVINGGVINAYGSNARLGKGEWMVVESDESDGTFVKLPADVVIVTNIDREHLDHYGSFEAAKAAYQSFVQNIPFYGFAVMCLDHPEVQALVGKVSDRRIITYGKSAQADVQIGDIAFEDGKSRFSLTVNDRRSGSSRTIDDLVLPMPGDHNVLNATAAIALAGELGVDEAAMRRGLASFAGVKRRFQCTGVVNGVTIYDDYGHHPVEIAAVLKAARKAAKGQVVAVMEPHRYTRLRDLFDDFCTCFNDADVVVVAPVYAAGESPIEGVDHAALAREMHARGHRHVLRADDADELAPLLAGVVSPGDMIVCLGAGAVTKWAHALPDQLAGLGRDRGVA